MALEAGELSPRQAVPAAGPSPRSLSAEARRAEAPAPVEAPGAEGSSRIEAEQRSRNSRKGAGGFVWGAWGVFALSPLG